MRIVVSRTFLNGRERYEAGEVRTVSDADGAHFIRCGWAAEEGKDAPKVTAPANVKLDVQSAKIGVKEIK